MMRSLYLFLAVAPAFLTAQDEEFVDCNVCGGDLIMSDWNEVLAVAGAGSSSIPCRLFEYQAQIANTTAEQCSQFQGIVELSGSCTCSPPGTPLTGTPGCSICGENRVSNPDQPVSLGGGGSATTCGQLEAITELSGPLVPAPACLTLQQTIQSAGLCSCTCFPENSLVEVRGRGPTKIQDIQLGDYVATGNGEYSQVYTFAHHDKEAGGNYVRMNIQDEAGQKTTLRASPIHLVFVDETRTVQAKTLLKGDTVLLENGKTGRITSITIENLRGKYAPFTMSGKIVVDGVVASSYTSLQGHETVLLHNGVDTGITWHWLSHASMAGQRLYCRYLVSCSSESYLEDGFSMPVSYCIRYFYAISSDENLQVVMMSVTIAFVWFMRAFELLLVPTLCAVGGYCALRKVIPSSRRAKAASC